MVVGGSARHGSATGPPQPRERGPDEHTWPGGGQLALVLHRGHAVGFRIRVAAGPDEGLAPRRYSRVGAWGAWTPGRLTSLAGGESSCRRRRRPARARRG